MLVFDPETSNASLVQGWGEAEAVSGCHSLGKWSGAVLSSFDNCIYCIPYNHPSVLKIDVRRRRITTVGYFSAEQFGFAKWNGAVAIEGSNYGGHGGNEGNPESSDACIYALPCSASCILCIDPAANNGDGEATTIAQDEFHELPGCSHKYRGAAVGSDGAIYGVPSDATAVLRVDVARNDERSMKIEASAPLEEEEEWREKFEDDDEGPEGD